MQKPKIRSLHQLLRNPSGKRLVAMNLIDAKFLDQILDHHDLIRDVLHTEAVQLHIIANAIPWMEEAQK